MDKFFYPRKFNKKIYNDSNPKESYRSNLSRWKITKFKSTSKHPYLRTFQQDNWKKWKEKKKEYVRNYFDRRDLKKASFPRIDTPLMVEMWRKGRVFRASAKKPPLQKDRGDVEKGDGEKNGGRWPRKNASLRSAASATKLFFQESRRHRRALLSAAVFLFIPLLRNAYIGRPAASRKEKRREGNGNRRNRRERNERAT